MFFRIKQSGPRGYLQTQLSQLAPYATQETRINIGFLQSLVRMWC